MSTTKPSHIPYEVVNSIYVKPLKLVTRESDQLKTAMGKAPSPVFLQAYALALSAYINDVQAIGRVTHRQVSTRLKKVIKHGSELRKSIGALEVTERLYAGTFLTEGPLLGALKEFIGGVSIAVAELDAAQGKGAMPGYAQQRLALTIAQALYLEYGKFPPMTRSKTKHGIRVKGSVFDSVLKCALDTGNKRIDSASNPTKDVMDLMKSAKSNFDEDAAKQFGEMFKKLRPLLPL